MQIKKIEQSVKGAVDLLLSDYDKQRTKLNNFPSPEDFRTSLVKKTDYLFSKGFGFTYFEDGQLLGFMTGYKVKHYFGEADGIYIPLHGHCISPDVQDREKLYQKMYTYAAQQWVEEGFLSHVITIFAQDKSLVNTWFNLGFGNRCVDSVRVPSEIVFDNDEISVKMAKRDDLDTIEELYQTDHFYFNQSPMFMPRSKTPSIQSLKEWLDEDFSHLWIATYEEKPVGYIKIEDEGENYITEHSSMMNITGAYVDPAYRGRGIGTIMLNTVQRFLNTHKYKLCGVDFESFNVSGNAFWNRYFTPYTYSLARRIDENILKIV